MTCGADEEDAMTTMQATGPRRARLVGIAWLALSALAIAVFAPLRYLLNSVPDLAATGDELAVHYAAQPRWAQAALVLHAGAGGLALLLSPVQLSARVRARAPRVHRVVGRTALVAIGVGAPPGWCCPR
jgi:protein-S-isoprenylcysteine O-methyltransferase Ste14